MVIARVGKGLLLVFWSISLGACQTLNNPSPNEKPQITRDTPLGEAYEKGIAFGGESLQELRDISRERQQLAELHSLAEKDLLAKADSLPTPVLLNVAQIYRLSASSVKPAVFEVLVRSKQESVRRVAWRLAASRPSADLGRAIEAYLGDALTKSREEAVLLPEMANAIMENDVKGAYSFLVLGLMQQGNPEYAQAMLRLDPSKASGPFVDYLNRADFDDLRQLYQKSINLLTCTVIFRFFAENPLPLNHSGIAQIFEYAVSRNRALSEMAFAVLEKHIPDNRMTLAILLSRQPVPVQVAFIESSQREATSNLRLLMADMKDLAQQKEVLEELNSQQGSNDR